MKDKKEKTDQVSTSGPEKWHGDEFPDLELKSAKQKYQQEQMKKKEKKSLLPPAKGRGKEQWKTETFETIIVPAAKHGRKDWPAPTHGSQDQVENQYFYPCDSVLRCPQFPHWGKVREGQIEGQDFHFLWPAELLPPTPHPPLKGQWRVHGRQDSHSHRAITRSPLPQLSTETE